MNGQGNPWIRQDLGENQWHSDTDYIDTLTVTPKTNGLASQY